MPKPGYDSITVKTKLKESLEKSAEQHNRTVPKEIAYLVEQEKKRTEKHGETS